MKARNFTGSKEDFDELLKMYIDLEKEDAPAYVQVVDDLLDMLKRNGSVCFLFESNDNIAGFAILYSDNKGGCIGESLYIKEQYRGSKFFSNVFGFLKEYVNQNYKYCNLIASNPIIAGLYERMGYNKKYVVFQYKAVTNG